MKALIVGYGKSGRSAAQLLSKKYEIIVYDDKRSIDTRPYKNIKGKDIFEEIETVDLMVVSPGVSYDSTIVMCAKKCGVEIISEIELAYRYINVNLISITGTNGKTTTTLLINKILENAGLKSRAVGNIGVPFSSIFKSELEYAVLELSSYQLEEINNFKSHIAICLNITEDHLQRHKSMKKYADCKFNIFKNQNKDDYAILNYDDEIVRGFAPKLKSKVLYVSEYEEVKGAYLKDGYLYLNLNEKRKIISINEIALKGRHNIYNALVSMLCAKILNISDEAIVSTLRYFKAPNFRIEYIGKIKGKDVYNDSKSTNVDSTIKACESMNKKTTLIIGGFNKGMSFEKLFLNLPKCIENIIIFGDNYKQIISDMPYDNNLKYHIAKSMLEAVECAFQSDSEVVLFSPGSSSFDRYSSYIERGEDFNKIVQGLFNC